MYDAPNAVKELKIQEHLTPEKVEAIIALKYFKTI